MKFILPVPITEETFLNSSAGALTDSTVAETDYTEWVPGALYLKSTIVKHSSSLYLSLKKHKSRTLTPDVDTNHWQAVAGPTSYSTWTSGGSYTAGGRVVRDNVHRVFEALTTHSGITVEPEFDATNWLDIGPTNRWAMFDGSASNVTMSASPLTFTVAPGIVDSAALIGLVGATSVAFTMDSVDGGGEVFSETVSLDDSADLYDWWDYYFTEIVVRTTVVLEGFPPFTDGEITVTVTGSTTVGVAIAAFGTVTPIEKSNFGAEVSIADYSKKETDELGRVSLVERPYADKLDVTTMVERSSMHQLKRKLTSVRATPCVWFEEDGGDSMTLYGYYKDWTINVAYPTYVNVTLSLEGLT